MQRTRGSGTNGAWTIFDTLALELNAGERPPPQVQRRNELLARFRAALMYPASSSGSAQRDQVWHALLELVSYHRQKQLEELGLDAEGLYMLSIDELRQCFDVFASHSSSSAGTTTGTYKALSRLLVVTELIRRAALAPAQLRQHRHRQNRHIRSHESKDAPSFFTSSSFTKETSASRYDFGQDRDPGNEDGDEERDLRGRALDVAGVASRAALDTSARTLLDKQWLALIRIASQLYRRPRPDVELKGAIGVFQAWQDAKASQAPDRRGARRREESEHEQNAYAILLAAAARSHSWTLYDSLLARLRACASRELHDEQSTDERVRARAVERVAQQDVASAVREIRDADARGAPLSNLWRLFTLAVVRHAAALEQLGVTRQARTDRLEQATGILWGVMCWQFARRGQLGDARALYDAMRARGNEKADELSIDTIVFSDGPSEWGQSRQRQGNDGVADVLGDQSEEDSLRTRHARVHPPRVPSMAYSALVQAYAWHGDLGNALAVLRHKVGDTTARDDSTPAVAGRDVPNRVTWHEYACLFRAFAFASQSLAHLARNTGSRGRPGTRRHDANERPSETLERHLHRHADAEHNDGLPEGDEWTREALDTLFERFVAERPAATAAAYEGVRGTKLRLEPTDNDEDDVDLERELDRSLATRTPRVMETATETEAPRERHLFWLALAYENMLLLGDSLERYEGATDEMRERAQELVERWQRVEDAFSSERGWHGGWLAKSADGHRRLATRVESWRSLAGQG